VHKPVQSDKFSHVETHDIIDNKWILVANSHTRYLSRVTSSLAQHINSVLTKSNTHALLSNFSYPLTTMNSDISERQIVSKKYSESSKKKYKFIILGDSHTEGLHGRSACSLDSPCSVMVV
jgi:hypothetical protein